MNPAIFASSPSSDGAPPSSFDFDRPTDRRRPGCVKWMSYPQDVIPMWVADMDFRSPEPVRRALAERVAEGTFGYEFPTADLAQAICAWLQRRYGWRVEPDEIVFLPGLVSGLNLVCRAFGRVGDAAVVLTPVYFPFLSAPVNHGMTLSQVALSYRAEGQRLHVEVDYEAFARAIGPRTSLFIHCHPHNPVGRAWTRNELQRLAEICLGHDVLICSDEIWSDLTLDGASHTPMASLSPEIARRCITLMAPSKTFNLPGLGFGFAVIQDARLRQRFIASNNGVLPHPNAMGLAAAQAAYTQCEDWLVALKRYLSANRDALLDYLAENMPDVRATVPEATYLGWLDFRAAGLADNPYRFFLERARVALSDGATFGPGGEGFLRLNFGCPRAQLLEALERMRAALRQR
ncbi:MAG: PatB family C-S lyase [Thermoflexales bacterium]|nr:PatB family C-S lyase [Thermoflexales bacterium]MDW8350931.1 PatB family C-S lyase [Anaerolineae bacterium]